MGVKHFVLIAVLLVDFSHISGLPVEKADSSTSSIKDGSADQISEETAHVVRSVELAPSESDEYDAAAEGGDPEEAPSDERSDRSIELQGGSQTFFPSFANLFEPRQQSIRLGSYANQEGAYSQRPSAYRSLLNNYPIFGGFRNSDGFAKHGASAALVDSGSSILGSGNFGVIRGGTFFGQSDTESDYSDGFSSFYNNGHGRPSLYAGSSNPRPTYNQDQFANFRDFADINTPSNPAYSHFVVVYANKNATVEEVNDNNRRLVAEPKNIIETLALLDKELTNEDATPINKEPKLSKSKLKLAKSKVGKKSWKKIVKKTQKDKSTDLEEPLLALS